MSIATDPPNTSDTSSSDACDQMREENNALREIANEMATLLKGWTHNFDISDQLADFLAHAHAPDGDHDA